MLPRSSDTRNQGVLITLVYLISRVVAAFTARMTSQNLKENKRTVQATVTHLTL